MPICIAILKKIFCSVVKNLHLLRGKNFSVVFVKDKLMRTGENNALNSSIRTLCFGDSDGNLT